MADGAKPAASKACTGCGVVKPLEDFHRHSTREDGRRTRCKECTNRQCIAWQRANPEKRKQYRRKHYLATRAESLAYARQYARENREAVRKTAKAHNERHPEKSRARARLHWAVKTGKVTKPDACEECGASPGRAEIQGHHHDYSKPLEVEWLCRDCHNERHGKLPLAREAQAA